MKISKFILIGLSFVALGLTSCKKDYICDCHNHGDIEMPEASKKRTFEGVKKDDAKEQCEAREAHLNNDHDYGTVHCEVK